MCSMLQIIGMKEHAIGVLEMNKEIGFLMKLIQDNLDRHANQRFKSMDLTGSQVRLMKFLRSKEGKCATQKEIEQYLQVAHPTVVGIIQRLEKKGFLYTEFDQVDKRQKYVYLTDKEEQLYNKVLKDRMEIEHMIVKNLTEEQEEELKELLTIVLESVRQDSDGRRQ